MQIRGTVKNGVVVLDSPGQVAETRVRIEIASESDPGKWIDDFAGCVADAPEDASLNYHYTLYGTRER